MQLNEDRYKSQLALDEGTICTMRKEKKQYAIITGGINYLLIDQTGLGLEQRFDQTSVGYTT